MIRAESTSTLMVVRQESFSIASHAQQTPGEGEWIRIRPVSLILMHPGVSTVIVRTNRCSSQRYLQCASHADHRIASQTQQP
jgi:hypothetical protein